MTEKKNIKDWIYKNKSVNDISMLGDDLYGFIYMVTHVPSNKKYIGKKVLYFNKTKRTKGKAKEKVKVESNWKNYYGSNITIIEMIKDGRSNEFKREIIELSKSKKRLSYLECKYQFKYDVLESDEWFNNNIQGRFFRKEMI